MLRQSQYITLLIRSDSYGKHEFVPLGTPIYLSVEVTTLLLSTTSFYDTTTKLQSLVASFKLITQWHDIAILNHL